MKRGVLIALGFVFFTGCLLWRAPAWLLVDVAGQQLPEDVQLGTATGSLWSGEFATVTVQGKSLEKLQWQLRPLQLLGGSPLRLKLAQPLELDADIAVGSNQQLQVHKLDARGQLANLLSLAAVPSMGFDGALSAQLSGVFSAGACMELDGKLELKALSGDVEGVAELAPLRASLSCQGRNILVKIDPDNAAKVRGTVSLPLNGGKPRGQITLSPTPGSGLFLSLQDFLGRPRNNKDFIIRL